MKFSKQLNLAATKNTSIIMIVSEYERKKEVPFINKILHCYNTIMIFRKLFKQYSKVMRA